MSISRVVLKISGEALGGASGRGLDGARLEAAARQCLAGPARGVETAVVVGGGYFVRGAELASLSVDRVTGDHMGMLATVLNGLAMRTAVERLGGAAVVLSAFPSAGGAGVEPFEARRCREHLAAGRVAFLAGGTGNPFFTTDTAAALRAAELDAERFFKATRVDGVYDGDPEKDPSARRFDHISYMEVVQKGLGVMDATAVTFCMEKGIPIVVFNLLDAGAFGRILDGEALGTVIS